MSNNSILDVLKDGSIESDLIEKLDNNDSDSDQELCKEYDEFPTCLDKVRRIIVIGDIHGDFKLTIDCLILAKVIDEKYNWIGGDTHVVQIGDQVDRCRPSGKYLCTDPRATKNDEASDVKILKFFTNLHKKAKKDGGGVYSLLGNHELLNVLDNMNYVSYENIKEFEDYKDPENSNISFNSAMEARKHAFKPGNEYGKFLGCTRMSSLIIGSNLFVHAGILPEVALELNITKRNDLERINNYVKKWLLGKISRKHVDKIVGSFTKSMFWTRVLGGIPPNITNEDPICRKYLDSVFSSLNIGSMIIGHTPQFYNNKSGINKTCDNKLWRVDTGGSGAFDEFDSVLCTTDEKMENRKPQVLEILDDNKFEILKYKD